MRPLHFFLLSTLQAAFLAWPACAQTIEPWTLKDGDRVLLIGSALVEHEKFHGYLETRLTRRYPQASILFRNLGWSGDTVGGHARTGGFQNPDGLARLLKEARAWQPTVIFLGYGMNESFDGAQGLPGFVQGCGGLLAALAPLKARVVVLSPSFHEDLGRPFPDPTTHNSQLEQYTAALEKLAAERKLGFVDLFHPLTKLKKANPKQQLTTNGLLPNQQGYWFIAAEIERQLLDVAPDWKVALDRTGKSLALHGARLGAMKAGPDELRFEVLPGRLPAPRSPSNLVVAPPHLRVSGLAAGQYLLKINGLEVHQASAQDWDRGLGLKSIPGLEQTDKLRAAVVKKNELCHRRWRPFNDHERHWGFIGGDFKLYDAQIAEQETVIARWRRPEPIRCEIVRTEKSK